MKLGFDGCYTQDSKGRKGRLILFWKDPMFVDIKFSSSGHIDAVISHYHRCLRFTGFYMGAQWQRRKSFHGCYS